MRRLKSSMRVGHELSSCGVEALLIERQSLCCHDINSQQIRGIVSNLLWTY